MGASSTFSSFTDFGGFLGELTGGLTGAEDAEDNLHRIKQEQEAAQRQAQKLFVEEQKRQSKALSALLKPGGKIATQVKKRQQGGVGRSDTIKTGAGGLGEVPDVNLEPKRLLGY